MKYFLLGGFGAGIGIGAVQLVSTEKEGKMHSVLVDHKSFPAGTLLTPHILIELLGEVVGAELDEHAGGRSLTVLGRAADPARGECAGDLVLVVPEWSEGAFFDDRFANLLQPETQRLRFVYSHDYMYGLEAKHYNARGLLDNDDLAADIVRLAHDLTCPCMGNIRERLRRPRRRSRYVIMH